MRTAMRIAFLLTATAIFAAAAVTPGARADHGPESAATASQRARLQSQPGTIEYVQAAEVRTTPTAIAHLSPAPEVANAARNAARGESLQNEVAAVIDGASDTSATFPAGCNGDTFATQQRNASDGGRGPVGDDSAEGSCPDDDKAKPRTRQVVIGDVDLSKMLRPEPAPVVLKFEAVIKIDLAGMGW